MSVRRPEQDGEKRPLKTLERVLSKAGLGSRVEARRWVHARRVKVNNQVVENPDHWIDTVYDLIGDVGTFVSPVGRLDYDTSGLLLLINDSQLAERVTNPAGAGDAAA